MWKPNFSQSNDLIAIPLGKLNFRFDDMFRDFGHFFFHCVVTAVSNACFLLVSRPDEAVFSSSNLSQANESFRWSWAMWDHWCSYPVQIWHAFILSAEYFNLPPPRKFGQIQHVLLNPCTANPAHLCFAIAIRTTFRPESRLHRHFNSTTTLFSIHLICFRSNFTKQISIFIRCNSLSQSFFLKVHEIPFTEYHIVFQWNSSNSFVIRLNELWF